MVEVRHDKTPQWTKTVFIDGEQLRLQCPEDPIIEGNVCIVNAYVRFNSIQTDYIHDSDGDERTVDKCPICNELETFDYKLESITDALKR